MLDFKFINLREEIGKIYVKNWISEYENAQTV